MKHVAELILNGITGDQLEALVIRLLDNDSHMVMCELNKVLGDTPEDVMIKDRDGATAWVDKRVLTEIKDHMRDTKKVQAIKVLRDETGWGLRESKNYVEDNFTLGSN